MKNLSETDLERVGDEVDAIMGKHKINPLMGRLCQYMQQNIYGPSVEMIDDDDELHEEAEKFLHKALVKVVSQDMAIAIWKNKNSFDEVA